MTHKLPSQPRSHWGAVQMAIGLLLALPGTAMAADTSYLPWVDEPYIYRLSPGDEITLRFPLAPELNTIVVLAPDGSATAPLLGSEQLAGLTAAQARDKLTKDYASTLRTPLIDLSINTFGSSQIYVGGEVKDPGAKPVKGLLSLNQAVIAAGGVNETAKTGRIVVLRQAPGEPQPHMLVLDLRRLRDDTRLKIQPGDVVFVPRSSIAEVDLFVKQYITSLLPFGFSLNFR
jgi:protein involved in polysaccharide export with SLBB domain